MITMHDLYNKNITPEKRLIVFNETDRMMDLLSTMTETYVEGWQPISISANMESFTILLRKGKINRRKGDKK